MCILYIDTCVYNSDQNANEQFNRNSRHALVAVCSAYCTRTLMCAVALIAYDVCDDSHVEWHARVKGSTLELLLISAASPDREAPTHPLPPPPRAAACPYTSSVARILGTRVPAGIITPCPPFRDHPSSLSKSFRHPSLFSSWAVHLSRV